MFNYSLEEFLNLPQFFPGPIPSSGKNFVFRDTLISLESVR